MTLEEAVSRIDLCVRLNLSLNGPQERHALKMIIKEIEGSTDVEYRRSVEDDV